MLGLAKTAFSLALARLNSYRHSEARQHICMEAQNHSARTTEARVFEKGDELALNDSGCCVALDDVGVS